MSPLIKLLLHLPANTGRILAATGKEKGKKKVKAVSSDLCLFTNEAVSNKFKAISMRGLL